MTVAHSDALVFFGATGDLAHKEIFPALQAMIRHGHLDMPIIGVAKSGWNLEQLKARARDSVEKYGSLDPAAFAKLSALLQYIDGDYRDDNTYRQLRAALGSSTRPLHYLAIPPSMFATVAGGLAKFRCTDNARVVVEKPFGRDLASAQALNRTYTSSFRKPRSTASITSWAKNPSRTSFISASPICFWNPFGTATTSPACRLH